MVFRNLVVDGVRWEVLYYPIPELYTLVAAFSPNKDKVPLHGEFATTSDMDKAAIAAIRAA